MSTTRLSEIRMKWMKENIYTDICEETIVKKYTRYLNTIKEKEATRGFVSQLSFKVPIYSEIMQDKRVCVIQIKERR